MFVDNFYCDPGMIFNYMNSQEVWGMFCLSYEGIYDRFGEFDAWYSQHGQGVAIPSLQSEWKSYMRVVLDSAVLRSRAEFDLMYTNKRYDSHVIAASGKQAHVLFQQLISS